MMAIPFRVEAAQINRLDALQLTKLLKLLLILEARSVGIAERSVDVALNINVPDGGEDGRIQWAGFIDATNYLPNRLSMFQNKAMDMGPQACANELKTSAGAIKPRIDEVLSGGGAYILFTTQIQNTSQKTANVEEMRIVLRALGLAYAETAQIIIYDAGIIEGWVNKFIPAVTTVFNWLQIPMARGLKTWLDWGQDPEYQQFAFVPDPDRQSAIADLRTYLSVSKNVARCIGLSGLGKTRLAYEVFNDGDAANALNKQVVYVDSNANPAILGLVSDWIQAKLEGIVVVDNCDAILHDNLRREVVRLDSRLSLLTLDFNMDNVRDTRMVQVKPMPAVFIKQMLAPVYGDKIPDLDRVVDFAEGFPQMAVLLAQSRLDNDPQMGNLNDDVLARKLLWGGKEPNEATEKILRGCALFDKFGLSDEASPEYQFIVRHLLDGANDDFHDCISKFEQRGVVDRRGRYGRIVPKPLAIWLAATWWRRSAPERRNALIQSDMPDSLLESFCEQTIRLDFMPEIKELAADVCGQQGPFGQAEVILSSRGSRLFRAFVVLNPEVTSHALARVIHQMPRAALLEIDGNVRRNFVYALERLCFHEHCFEESAWTLLKLASAENESWSNNATGQFKQLFSTFLSGTEAPPRLRLRVIDAALGSNDREYRGLAVEALDEVITTRGGSRIVGAEYQGTGAPLEEWKPTVWQEAFDYWNQGLTRLTKIVCSQDELKERAKKSIAEHIRGLVIYGRIDELDEAIRAIVAVDGPLWIEAKDSIKTSLEFDSKKMPKAGIERLTEWLALLTPETIPDRLVAVVTKPPFDHVRNDAGDYVDMASINSESLAKEFATQIKELLPYLAPLFVGDQRQAHWFAKKLVEGSGEWKLLLTESLVHVSSIENANIAFLLGVLDGLYVLDKKSWIQTIDQLSDMSEYQSFYTMFLSTGKFEIRQLEKLVTLLKQDRIKTSELAWLSYGRVLDHVPVEEVCRFVLDIESSSDSTSWQAFQILYMYCYNNSARFSAAIETLEKLAISVPLNKGSLKPQTAWHSWSETVNKILEQESDTKSFSLDLARSILSANTKREIDLVDVWHYVHPVLRTLLRKHGGDIWHVFAQAIREADALQNYKLTQLLGTRGGEMTDQAVISDLPNEILRQWCNEEGEEAAVFVARTIQVMNADTNGIFHLAGEAQFLLDAFGSSTKVLNSLDANFGTFSWSGSLVPYFERQRDVLLPYLDHANQTVRSWVAGRLDYINRTISDEKSRDMESDWNV